MDPGLSPEDFGLGLAESGLSSAYVGMSWGIFRTGSDCFRTGYGDITESIRFRVESGIFFARSPKIFRNPSGIFPGSLPNLSHRTQSDPKQNSQQHIISDSIRNLSDLLRNFGEQSESDPQPNPPDVQIPDLD